jgi:hypothetical protein
MLFDLLNKKAINPTNNNGKAKFPINPKPEGDPVSVGCASMSTFAARNFFINSGAVAGNSTQIL